MSEAARGSTEPHSSWTTYDLPLREDRAAGSPATVPDALRWQADSVAILRNQAWFCSLRWFAAAGLAALAGLSAMLPRSLQPSWAAADPAWPALAAGTLVVLNAAYLVLLRRASKKAPPAASAEIGLWVQILADLAVLTGVVHLMGSVASFAPFMYLFHIVLACVFFPYGRSLLVVIAALGMYLACLLLEGAVGLPTLAWEWLSVALVSGTVWYLASRLSHTLRRRDVELMDTNRRLEAALEERTHHLLRTTHQLKAPFAAIHANTQLLLGGLCGELPPAAMAVAGQIAARCEMLSRGITSMLQLANLRSAAQARPDPVEVDLDPLIHACVAALKPLAARRGIELDEDLSPAKAHVPLDHARMIVENLIANAIAYSRDGQHVCVSIEPGTRGGPVAVIRDEGIGIAPEKLPRIFEDYYRTSEAARHNNASTGLGLAIVRQSALASGIAVRVRSAPDLGTEFSVTFPGPSVASEGPS